MWRSGSAMGSCPIGQGFDSSHRYHFMAYTREQHRDHQRKWRSENKHKVVLATRKWQEKNKVTYGQYKKSRMKEINNWYKKYKQTLSCKHCGFSDWRALDFHHRDPKEKKFNIGAKAFTNAVSTLMEEMAKCDVLCANCHRIETHQQRQRKEL